MSLSSSFIINLTPDLIGFVATDHPHGLATDTQAISLYVSQSTPTVLFLPKHAKLGLRSSDASSVFVSTVQKLRLPPIYVT